MVVLPSPAVVGVIAVTRINLPFFSFSKLLIKSKGIFALSCPKGINSSGLSCNFSEANFSIGILFASLAISISVLNFSIDD